MLTSTPTPTAPPTPTFVRPALALLSGLGIAVIFIALATVVAALILLRGRDASALHADPVYLVATLVICGVGASAGAFATARVTEGRSPFTVALLALVLFMSAIVPVLRGAAEQSGTPDWHAIARALLEPFGVFVGAYLERRWRLSANVAS